MAVKASAKVPSLFQQKNVNASDGLILFLEMD